MNELNLTHEKLPKSVLRRLGMFVLALCMTLSLLPGVLPPADAAFSDAAMDKLLNWGVVTGYPDGALHPESPLTRAEFVAMVNRAYGYNELGVTPFIDVPDNAWYRDDINIAYNANYFSGVSPRMAAPGSSLTREQAMVLLARNMRMEPVDGEVTEFTDGRDFSDWSRGYARAAKEAGVIGGYGDGSYKPKNSITRGEMAVMLQRALGTLVNKPGTHTLSDVYGNVTISSPNVILRNSTIAGDLYITGGLSLGDVTLENVRVLGRIIIAGGGESQSGESVILRNVQADELIVDSIAGQYVSLASEGDTLIGEAILRTSAYVQDRTRPGEGLLQITLDSLEQAAVFTLSGNLETVVNKTPNSTLNIAMGTVDVLTIDEEARNSLLHLDINSTVKELNLDTATTVTGVGDIGDLFVNAPGANVEMLPDRVIIRPGLTADIAGQTMNAKQAQELSSDPRLNAGYPKVKNIAPTNANSIYSANKGGTVYWAVSNTVDGSIGEEDLIEPSTDNTRIVLSGSTPVELSNTEYTAPFEKLTPDSNYYLSTIMVDARGRRSPIKVASFSTPDNTVPAFSQGYPTVMKNYCESITVNNVVQRDEEGNPRRNYRVQVAAMPNKSCVLYYAVYPAGSTAPTAQQFRTGALGTPIRSGVEDATKNRINFVELTGLEELTNYDIYLCYIDADGSRSSAVRKLTFRTVDGKPPRFQYETPVVTQEQLTGLRLSANVSENATIYWVATKDANYVKDGDWTDTEWWERACRQIESGTNGIRSGSVAARANADVTINITGLQPATRYYIFFVAKDAAGNYSEFFRAAGVTDSGIIINPGDDPDIDPPQQYTPHNKQPYVYYLKASTLDNIPPTATQEFTHYDTADETRPYADTDIQIHFSEAVMQYSTHRNAAPDAFNDFEMLYNAHLKARKAYDDAVAAGDVSETELKDLYNAWSNSGFVNALRATIKLYNNASIVNDSVVERTAANEASVGDDWVIDYRWAEVTSDADTGEMTVIFPTNSEDSTRSALNLSSGATYHFVLDDICDTSSNKNRMGRTQLPDFTTISAQVNLNTINVTRVNYKNPDGTLETEIPIDMAFSMTPVSTSVEADVDWDILFWSDTAVAFEIYEISENHNDADAVAIRPLSGGHFPSDMAHYSVTLEPPNNETTDSDATADNYRGYAGRSYFNHFYDVRGTFPSVTGKGNVLADYSVDEDVNLRGVMERNEPKFYGIHITSIGDTDEEHGRNKTWDATIKFRISVVTSNSTNLGNLATEISNAVITDWDGNPQDGGSVIHSPRPFTLTKRFANLAAPEFDADYPMFEYTDTTVKMTLRLDRPGTGYYVIAPASAWVQGSNNNPPYKTYIPSISTSVLDGSPTGTKISPPPPDNIGDSEDKELTERYWAKIPAKGGDTHYVPLDGSNLTSLEYDPETNTFDPTKPTSKFLLTAPTVRTIYNGTDPNSSGISGKWEQTGITSVIEEVDGLEPETVYFVYFVLQGVGQVYSDYVQLFQFTTQPLSRPYLSVDNYNSNARIASTNMPATVDTGLFLLENANDSTNLLGKPLKDVLDPSALTVWAQYSQRDNIDTGKKHEEDTIWQALCAPFESQGSYFDRFANETTKDAVASLIRTSTGATDRLGGELNVAQALNERRPYSFPDIMKKDIPYLLLAVARGREGASGHALGFIGARLILQDTDPPSITQIGGAVTVDYKKGKSGPGGFKMTGYITLTFDHGLWLYNDALTPRDPLTGSMLSDYFIDRDISADKPFAAQNSSSTSPVTTVRVNLAALMDDGTGGVQQDEDFTANMRLCAERSGTRHLLTIQIHYDAATQKVTAVVTSDSELPTADKWFPDPSQCNITTTVVAPDPSDFTLSTQNLRLNFGDSANIIAYLSPTGAKGKVRFTWKGTPVADIETISDTEIRVSAVNSVSETVSGTIVATLCYEDGTTVTQGGQPVTLEIAVTIATKEVAYIRVIPPASERVNLSVSKGIRIVQFDIEVVDPNNLLSDDDKIISRSVDNNGASSTTLICTVEPTLGRPGRGTVTVMTAEGAKPPTIVTFTIKAANPALITSLNIQVNLPD